MKFITTIATLLALAVPTDAFMPVSVPAAAASTKNTQRLSMSYLDELNKQLGSPEEEPEVDDSREATNLKADKVDRGGVGDWSEFVDFNEFDGGDGQMGVAGDGSGNKLESFDMSSMAKSKTMSAKNAWGQTTGYADQLKEQGMEAQRAQQLENWKNQQEVLVARKQQQYMAEQFDNAKPGDDDQWSLASFGVERNTEVDLDQELGAVQAGDIDGVIELKARMGQYDAYEFNVKNEFMGFADFRARFTPDSAPVFSIEPTEGSLDKKGTDFNLRFRADAPGSVEGYLIIETEDFKKTYHLIGSTA